jgi:hypothetical protein
MWHSKTNISTTQKFYKLTPTKMNHQAQSLYCEMVYPGLVYKCIIAARNAHDQEPFIFSDVHDQEPCKPQHYSISILKLKMSDGVLSDVGTFDITYVTPTTPGDPSK